jgi:hypothetical protein
MSGIAATMQDVINAAPTQMRPTEEKLDTIAEILAEMLRHAGGTMPVGNNTNHDGLVYYGIEYGWHPIGWSPGGSAAPVATSGNFAAGGGSSSAGVVSELRTANARLTALLEAQESAARDAKADRVSKKGASFSGYTGKALNWGEAGS